MAPKPESECTQNGHELPTGFGCVDNERARTVRRSGTLAIEMAVGAAARSTHKTTTGS